MFKDKLNLIFHEATGVSFFLKKLGFSFSTKHKGGGALIIHKILNNNVVITLDDDKREQIVMGKGIAFKKRIGDWVPDESIDQVFI